MNKIPTTFAAFKQDTGLNGDPEKRGTQMRYVDGAFENYEKVFASPSANYNTQCIVTSCLYLACKKWLQDKQSKSIQKKNLLTPNTYNINLERRRDHVSKVAKECLKELRLAAWITGPSAKFDTRKIELLRQGKEGPSAMPAVPLSGTYMHERETYEDLKKRGLFADDGLAVSASLVHVYLEGEKREAEFERLSKKDFLKFIERYAREYNTAKKHAPYFRKKKRLGYLVDIDVDGLLCSASNGTPIDCQLPAFDLNKFKKFKQQSTSPPHADPRKDFDERLHMYAMDRYGNLFERSTVAAAERKAYGPTIGWFSHSAFNAGRAVICAGSIGINQGRLMWIDNQSGHYKPGPDQLKKALEILKADGVDLEKTVVPLQDRNTSINSYYYGDKFLTNGKAFDTD